MVCLIHCVACICLLAQFMMLEIQVSFFSYVKFSFSNFRKSYYCCLNDRLRLIQPLNLGFREISRVVCKLIGISTFLSNKREYEPI